MAHGPSLTRLVEHLLAPEFTRLTGVAVRFVPFAALGELRFQSGDTPLADVVLVTDPSVFNEKATAAEIPYYFVVAADAMAVGYRKDSPFGRAVVSGKPWFEALRAGGVRFGRADPALDPLGYRAIFVLELAQRYYEASELARQILRPDQIFPAAELVPMIQRGNLDVALLYRSQVVEGGLALLDLPIEISLADPGRRWVYAEASVDVRGDRIRGEPLALGAAPLARAPHPAAALRFVDFLGTRPARRILEDAGFVVPPDFPRRRAWGQLP